ncbi:MAG: class I SAM-dependent methyltransferase [Sphingomonas sp.]|uniref:class I SAM-dependent methyltransferase n=1 Tax=Sphingomonas sp. TaxID=28214 RepID=UPI0035A88894|nr:class I SAM-dependent methyltransferase [Sphingomonas sp.]
MRRTNTVFDKLSLEPTDSELMKLRCDSQSLQYYADMSNFLSSRIHGMNVLSLLDVGSRTGSGLAFLRLVHHPAAFTRLKFDPVAGIDIDPMFEQIVGMEFPDIQGLTGDIFNLPDDSWDVVICSHTIEHIPEAEKFVEQLSRIARKYVAIACPFAESPLSDDHCRTIDYDFFKKLGFFDIKVFESQHWHSGVVCLAIKTI